MPDLKAIFFDLDDTLWDHQRALREALETVLLNHLKLDTEQINRFYEVFLNHNSQLWRQLIEGKVSNEEVKIGRFSRTLAELGFSTQPAPAMSAEYLHFYSHKTCLKEGAAELIKNLDHRYSFGLITNGFHDAQERKMQRSFPDGFFKYLITPEVSGSFKPYQGIFKYALGCTAVEPEQILYIGDLLEFDVQPATEIGFQVVWYNWRQDESEPPPKTKIIDSLPELLKILS